LEDQAEINSGHNDCGSSTFVSETANDSPLISDCQSVVKGIAAKGSSYLESGYCGNPKLLQVGTYSFGLHRSSTVHENAVYIGSDDIVDVINNAIKKVWLEGNGGGGRGDELSDEAD
jgi:hypothetical protein